MPSLAGALLGSAADLAGLGLRTERSVRRALSRTVSDAALGLLESAFARALEGPLVEAVARDLARYAVIERAAAQMFAGDGFERIAGAAMEAVDAERIADRILASSEAERMVARVIDSRLLDETVARLLESPDLWLLVDEIARSPSVTDAISHQSMGFAEQVAGNVREHSQSADARVERAARRLFRREARDGDT